MVSTFCFFFSYGDLIVLCFMSSRGFLKSLYNFKLMIRTLGMIDEYYSSLFLSLLFYFI